MAEVSAFRGVLNFFVDLGIYDVILPFLLVFSIVFAILDKTRVLGYETIDNKQYPKKSINAIVAFCIAFFVVASAKLVEVIMKVSSEVVILLLAIVLFMALIGVFMEQDANGVSLKNYTGWQKGFMVACLIGIVLIFLDALGWIDIVYNFLKDHWSNELVASVVLLLTVVGVMAFVVGKGDGQPAADKDKGKEGSG
jgi:uncharacterized membrane protein